MFTQAKNKDCKLKEKVFEKKISHLEKLNEN